MFYRKPSFDLMNDLVHGMIHHGAYFESQATATGDPGNGTQFTYVSDDGRHNGAILSVWHTAQAVDMIHRRDCLVTYESPKPDATFITHKEVTVPQLHAYLSDGTGKLSIYR